MIQWPEDLVADIARRKAVIFLGAGISMNALTATNQRPKTWAQLLEKASTKVPIKTRRIVKRLIKERDFLTACEILKAEMGKDIYESFLTEEYLAPQFKPAPVHETIFKIDSRIVATPNIDKIYEAHANHLGQGSVKVKHYYDEDVADAIRRPNRVVLKVHGTIDTPARMIFTRREYAAARSEYSEFYAILDALIVTHTFLFLGCGVNDPDIRLVLENYAFRFRHTRRHYMTMANESLSPYEVRALEDSSNLKLLPYKLRRGGHEILLDSVDELQKLVETKREFIAQQLDW